MKLYELTWGVYPRRVIIYLAEKGIINNVERIAFEVSEDWPPPILKELNPAGTLPVLDTGDGTLIRSSIAILEYLEESVPSPNMLGETTKARALTRELVSVIDEATMHLGMWVHNGSPVFAQFEKQSMEAAIVAANAYHKKLKLLDTMAGEVGAEYLTGNSVTMADCITASTLQAAKEIYGIPIPNDCPGLAEWYSRFISRPSMADVVYPEWMLEVTLGLLGHCGYSFPDAA